LEEVRAIFDKWDLHSDVIGRVTDDGIVRVRDGDEIVAEVPAAFYTDECPTYVREGRESEDVQALRAVVLDEVIPDIAPERLPDTLQQMLGSPNICSREPIIRTYDHTIMSNTVIAPIQGDAAVLRIKGTNRGIATATDCNPRYVFLDPYVGGMHALAEAARNVSCVGAEPVAFTNCLNFGNPEKADVYFQLEQAISGMARAAEALDTPVVSGNVSLYNETRNESVLPTPTIGMVGLLKDISKRVGLSARDGEQLLLLGPLEATLGASEYAKHIHGRTAGAPPSIDLDLEAAVQSLVRDLIGAGEITAAHDTSEGGLLVAVLEMLMLQELGADLDLAAIIEANSGRVDTALFGEAASRIIVATANENIEAIRSRAEVHNVQVTELGKVRAGDLDVRGFPTVELRPLRTAWRDGLIRT
ncbi:MAG: AIR synthase related protein, partial [Chloroflexota bacterium]